MHHRHSHQQLQPTERQTDYTCSAVALNAALLHLVFAAELVNGEGCGAI
jgi:hypothetical protein